MTGAFEVVDEEKNRASGADEFITKPFESQSLIDATNRMLALTAQRASAPVSAPAPQVAAQPQPAPVAAPSVDDVWATGFDMEPAVEAAPEPFFDAPPLAAAAPEIAPVKATVDDDLWGAFDMDSVELSTPSPQPAAVAVDSSDDFFSFEAETPKSAPVPAADDFILEDFAPAKSVETSFSAAIGFEPVGEQELSFGDVESVPMTPSYEPSAPSEDDFSSISFDEPTAAPVAPAAANLFEPPPLAPVFVPAPAPPVLEPPPLPPVVETAPIAAPAPAVQATAAAIAAFDETQVKELIASLSRDVIEKIVWEVVPDLAEMLIKEEIRKLKAGIA
jgi:CheY-like chemotaxis protein